MRLSIEKTIRLSRVIVGWCFLVLSMQNCVSYANHLSIHTELPLERPNACVSLRETNSIHIANQDSAKIVSVRISSNTWTQTERLGKYVKDLVQIPKCCSLVVATESPNRLIQFRFESGQLIKEFEYALDITPESLAMSHDGQMLCVVDRWNSKAVILIKSANSDSNEYHVDGTLSLPLYPKFVCSTPIGFVVSDAFDGILAVIRKTPMASFSIHRYEFRGHHIGGMQYDDVNDRLLVTHQILSKVAQTSREDIMWGMLMQNVLRVIPSKSLDSDQHRLDSTSNIVQLGDFGQGESDPSHILFTDRHWIVSVSGADRLIRRAVDQPQKDAIALPAFPTRLCHVGSDQAAVVCTLSNRVCLVDIQTMQMVRTYGCDTVSRTAVQLGERSFHDASLSKDHWMSCNSCHVDGHSANHLVDTFGDGTFGTPKRIPSLLENFDTAPFGWTGNKPEIDDQIRQTLDTTMHASLAADKKSEIADQISKYLATLTLAGEIRTQKQEREAQHQIIGNPTIKALAGKRIFVERGCVRCHDPAYSFTSRRLFDVGVTDQFGHSEFSPPTLRGVALRRSFFHDGRFQSLETLLLQHPKPDMQWESEEIEAIVEFLRQTVKS